MTDSRSHSNLTRSSRVQSIKQKVWMHENRIGAFFLTSIIVLQTVLCYFLLYSQVIQFYIKIYIHFYSLFHYGLSSDSKYSSLC